MKKLLLILALASGTVYGQTDQQPSKSTISVNGTSKVSIIPDMTELNIHVSSLKMNMADATKTLGDQTQKYLKILKDLGFKETDVKTTHFSASKNRIYRENGPVDSGYVVSQNLTVKFAYNQVTLQKIAARFSEVKDPVDFNIGFYISDQLRDNTAAELQAKAVADARMKANNLSKAAGVKMTTVKAIVYGNDVSNPVYYKDVRMFANTEMAADGANLSFAPQEMELQENVTVVWVIE
ncbi:SIMPL domain-containing protein [Fluviicola sp.]|uniref:SIMPL domain-containing protein n=1 Tax=Fluviicola sp. TaxID=1917219 RepID=UPI0031D9C208